MRLRDDLLAWFDRHRRDLPWRRTKDPYRIWVSEVMLQQTQVATVIPYWHRFIERFPDVGALARAELPDVLALWRGLGYYSRARNLHRAAKEIASRGGELPRTAQLLQELPGFGRYTAGAVASIAFGEPAPLVDGNVARVLARLFASEGDAWPIAEALIAGERPGDWNQALMELGATLCRPVRPDCLLCPVRGHCAALARGRVDELPVKKLRARPKRLELSVAVRQRGGRFLLARRKEEGLFGGLWELPTAPLGKSALGLRLGKPLGLVRRTLTHRALELHLFRAAGTARRGGEYLELRWASLEEARRLGMSAAMEKAFELAVSQSTLARARPSTG